MTAKAMRRAKTAAGVDVTSSDIASRDGYELRGVEGRLTLVADGLSLSGDFSRLMPRVRPDRLGRELLVRAVRLRGRHDRLRVVDATAGLGEDAFLLAADGCEVTLFERNPIVAALLADALARASHLPELSAIVARMGLVEADSIVELPRLEAAPDVVVLDPMFPSRHQSAASRKKAHVLQRLEQPCGDEETLFHSALAAHPRRIVVKRPVGGPYLAGAKPSHSLLGKIVRYDCYAPRDGKLDRSADCAS